MSNFEKSTGKAECLLRRRKKTVRNVGNITRSEGACLEKERLNEGLIDIFKCTTSVDLAEEETDVL